MSTSLGSARPSLRSIFRQSHGFTLIELMIGLAITLMIVLAAFTLLNTSDKAARATRQVVDTQSNVRTAMQLLSRDVKMAGFGMQGPVGNCPTPFVPHDQNPTGVDTGPDSVSLVLPAISNAYVRWVLATAATGPITQIQVSPAHLADMVLLGMTAGSTISLDGVVSGTVATVTPSTGMITLQSAIGAPALFPINTPVYLLQCVTYQVIQAPDPNAICGGTAPCLVRGVPSAINQCDVPTSPCRPVVDGIEDLQLAYACDGCLATNHGGIPDRIIDDQGTTPNSIYDTTDFVTDNTWTTPPFTPDTIRVVQISVVARQLQSELGLGERTTPGANSAPLLVSDHNHATDATYLANPAAYQQQRRRLLVRTVDARNLGF